jgi:hypothetical protein
MPHTSNTSKKVCYHESNQYRCYYPHSSQTICNQLQIIKNNEYYCHYNGCDNLATSILTRIHRHNRYEFLQNLCSSYPVTDSNDLQLFE